MKYTKHFLYAAMIGMLASCADDKLVDFQVEKPAEIAQYEYLNAYDALKTYIDRSKANPDFKLGIALGANDFIAGTQVHTVARNNFDEMTAGNAMKYASCVANDGSMDFSTVTRFVDAARQAGMTIYGHTLAWHSQQNNTYLNGIIADKVLDTGPGEEVEVEDARFNYSTMDSYTYWNQKPENAEITINENGYLNIYNPEVVDPFYALQYFVADGINWNPTTTYNITMRVRASEEASATVAAGTWSTSVNTTISISTDWKEITLEMAPNAEGAGYIMFQTGNFAGTIEIEWIKVSHTEVHSTAVKDEYLYQNDFSGTEHPGGWGNNSTFEIVQGAGPDGSAAMKITNPSAVNSWEAQMAVDFETPFTSGETYFVSYKIKGSASGNFSTGLQVTSDYSSAGELGSVAFDTEWKDVTLSCMCSKEGATRLIFSFGDFAGDIYIDDLAFYIQVPANTEPLTPEEKKDTLTWAMDNWINGMMEACGGYVVAWDAVNEAISGTDADGDGYYDLQSATNGDPSTNFYWQDYLGNEDYVPIVTQLAEKYFVEHGGNAADLKLFINDYNLESWWDGNKKMKSLIHWIEVWEENGARIDGIGTQMHVSYILNEADQKAQEDAIVNMFQLMASTGKLIKISELDMGIVENAFGTGIKTEDVTYEQQLKMAEFYQFIIQKYFEIIPQAQQYGITQWCMTDSPADSGWRGGEPVGLWDLNYNRKPTYGGFANGLAGSVIVTPTPNMSEE